MRTFIVFFRVFATSEVVKIYKEADHPDSAYIQARSLAVAQHGEEVFFSHLFDTSTMEVMAA